MKSAGALTAIFGAGGLTLGVFRSRRGAAHFDDWRALPGMPLNLSLDLEDYRGIHVDLMATYDGQTQRLQTLSADPKMTIHAPHVATADESYFLRAVVRDWRGEICTSEAIEVLSRPYSFGM
ncbi:MAG: hypothetical protein FWC40_03215 [Proteobacteria bacterium]|nr:hypothetical protein [Pseudomonadota bacterium]